MALFVHLASGKDIAAIRRSGIAVGKWRTGVYAMPVLPNFFVSHQWLRELKGKWTGPRTLLAVYFRIPDEQPVLVGRYSEQHARLPAAQAAATIAQAADPLGWEVIVPRRIARTEIHRIRRLPQTVGWRYQPDVRTYYDGSIPWVIPGGIKARRRRAFLEARYARRYRTG